MHTYYATLTKCRLTRNTVRMYLIKQCLEEFNNRNHRKKMKLHVRNDNCRLCFSIFIPFPRFSSSESLAAAKLVFAQVQNWLRAGSESITSQQFVQITDNFTDNGFGERDKEEIWGSYETKKERGSERCERGGEIGRRIEKLKRKLARK